MSAQNNQDIFPLDLSKPPPRCFTCGRGIYESEYDKFHKEMQRNPGKGQWVILDEMGYPLDCCRRMLLSDPKEHREIMKLYIKADFS